MSVLVDPVAVAQKVLGSPRGWCKTSVFEIKALAAQVLYQDEVDPEQPDPIYEADGLHLMPMRPADLERQEIVHAIEDVNAAFDALESARFSARERAARAAFKGSLQALSKLLKSEICHERP